MKNLFGRRVIYTPEKEITSKNVVEVLNKALAIHAINREEIDYLERYSRGDQPILARIKDVRPEICNKVVENRANEIVTFKTGYTMSEPVQYVSRRGDESAEGINELNNFMFAENKAALDVELAEWFFTCGTAYRLVLPYEDDGEESPFEISTLDPRETFIIYHSSRGKKPLAGVMEILQSPTEKLYAIYTKDCYFEIKDGKIVTEQKHLLGSIPIIEYPAGRTRMGAFEAVLPLLDAINTTASNRIDGVEQFIQALLVLKGIDIENEKFEELRRLGGICVPLDGDVKYLIQELNQEQTQTLVDHMYQTVLTVCSMPNRNGGSSTSDTGAAVTMRDGWSAAEVDAKLREPIFKASEKRFLRVALAIANSQHRTNLKLSDIDIRFTRRNYENIQEKAQVLDIMLKNEKIEPKLAFEHSGMFTDPNLAYTVSMKYYRSRKAEQEEELKKLTVGESDV